MDINLRVTLGWADSVVLGKLNLILQKDTAIMSALDNLGTNVAATRTVVGSAVTLLNGLKKALDDAIASGDPAKIQQFADDLAASTQALADAVAADTPAAGGGAGPTDPGTPADPGAPGGV